MTDYTYIEDTVIEKKISVVKKKFKEYVSTIYDTLLRTMCEDIYKENTYLWICRALPYHHYDVCGLAYHAMEVADFCYKLCDTVDTDCKMSGGK